MKRNTPCHCDTVTKLYSNLPSILGKNEQQAERTKSLQGSLEEKIKEITCAIVLRHNSPEAAELQACAHL